MIRFAFYKLNRKQMRIILLALIIFTSFTSDMIAQNTRTKVATEKPSKSKKKVKEEYKLMEHLSPDIMIGNLGFFNGFYVSAKLNIGYKLSDRFTAGLGTKLFYNQYAQIGKDISVFDKGGFVYARGKITESIYAQVEYTRTDFANRFEKRVSQLEGGSFSYPSIGLGYASGSGTDWTYHAHVLYVANNEAQDYTNVVEYWAGVAYRF
jgi:hypothetical protein